MADQALTTWIPNWLETRIANLPPDEYFYFPATRKTWFVGRVLWRCQTDSRKVVAMVVTSNDPYHSRGSTLRIYSDSLVYPLEGWGHFLATCSKVRRWGPEFLAELGAL